MVVRNNQEGEEIIRFIKIRRLKWLGKAKRMPKEWISFRIFDGEMHVRRIEEYMFF